MTNDQFELIAKLIRAKPGPIQEAARAVLVKGAGPTEAARQQGLPTPQQVSNTVRRMRLADAAIRRVYLEQQADA